MRSLLATLLLSALLAGSVSAQDDDQLHELRARFDSGISTFRKGDVAAARASFEAVGTALAPAFAAGRIKPRSTDEAWVLYAGSVLMQSDLWRYHLNDPNRARDIEAEMATQAQKLGYADLAAAEWLAVADIERFDLHRDDAAVAAYRKVLALDGIDLGLRGQALQGLARTPGGEPAALQKVAADLPLDLKHIEATSLVIANLPVYPAKDPVTAYSDYAAAHPRSYRAVYANYSGVLVTIVFRHEHAENPQARADVFLAQHPDDVLGLDVLDKLAEFQGKEGNAAEAAKTRERAESLSARLGLSAATPVKPSAKLRPLLNAPRAVAHALDTAPIG